MNECRYQFWICGISLALSLAATICWFTAARQSAGSVWTSSGLFLGWTLLAVVAAATVLARWQNQWTHGLQILGGLLNRPLADFQDSHPPGVPLPTNHPCRAAAQRLAARLHEIATQLQESEDHWAALEVQLRRQTAEQDRTSAVLASLHEPVLVVDEYGELLQANPSAERLFNFDAHQVHRRAVSNITQCQQLLDLLNETQRRASHTTRLEEIELVDSAGRRRWHEVTASSFAPAGVREAISLSDSAVLSASATTQGAVVVLRDITDQKAAQRRYAEFVSSVSHEMKTPLSSIKAYVELLVDGDADDEQTREEFLSVINSQADRLHRLIDNVLNLARIESGVVEVRKQAQPLNPVLQQAFDTVKPAAEAKRIQLVAALSPLYLPALIDHDQMLQAAINLLSNAVKYTPAGGTVSLRSRDLDGQVEFEVEDTGVGLSPDDCVRIFDRFYRVKKDQQMAAGTGLGLPLAKTIVEDMHGGRLSLRSVLGQGSAFTVSLPAASELV